MSHSLSSGGKRKRGMAQHSRSIGVRLTGDVRAEEVHLLQSFLDAGTLSQVEITRDGFWINGKPGAEFRALVRWFLDRGFEREGG